MATLINAVIEVHAMESHGLSFRTALAKDHPDDVGGSLTVVPSANANGVVLRAVTSDELGKAYIKLSEVGARELLGVLQRRYT